MKVLAVRNDRLGDFMLAWPALQTLARNLPEAELVVLARDYTAPLVGLCAGVSSALCDPDAKGDFANAHAIARLVRGEHFDAAVAFFSRFDTALGLRLAHIPIRVAPATKLAQVFYSHRLRQRRSRSEKPEYVYNLELAEYFLRLLGVGEPIRPGPPYLRFPSAETLVLRRDMAARLGLDASLPLVFLHPGHGGSSPAPPAAMFARIGCALQAEGAELVISAGPADEPAVAALSRELGATRHVVYRSESGLTDYARHVAAADLFVAGSTGPLHIAGALDVPTVAFYTRRRSATALRWQTLNGEGRRLAWMPPETAEENDFGAIDRESVAAEVVGFMRKMTRKV